MSILKYLQESLYDEHLIIETQKEAKQLAQSGKNPNFTMETVNKLKNELGNPKLYKYMGWIARNWDDLPQDKIANLIKHYDERFGRKDSNLKPMSSYKKNPEQFVKDVQVDLKAQENKTDSEGTKSSERIKTIWESKDGKIKVVIPETKSASIKSGRGSNWCTAANTSPEVDYDAQHMFCKYVLDRQGLMIYIINDNLPETDPFHKTAIRLIDENEDGNPEIAEIRDMNNVNDYIDDDGNGWDSRYQEYLDKYNIPLEKILETIKVENEIGKLDSEREKYKKEKEFIYYIENGNKEKAQEMVDNGYIPHSSALNTAIEYKRWDIIDWLSQFKTVKPNDDTMLEVLNTHNKHFINDFMKKHPNVSFKNIPLNHALKYGNPEIIDKVINAGNMPNYDTIEYAINTYDPDIIKKIVNLYPKGTKLNIENVNSPELLNIIFDAGIKPATSSLSHILTSLNSEQDVKKFLNTLKSHNIKFTIYDLASALNNRDQDAINTILKYGIDSKDSRLNVLYVALKKAILRKTIDDKTLDYIIKNVLIHNKRALTLASVISNKHIMNELMKLDAEPSEELIDKVYNKFYKDKDFINKVKNYISNYNKKHGTDFPTTEKL